MSGIDREGDQRRNSLRLGTSGASTAHSTVDCARKDEAARQQDRTHGIVLLLLLLQDSTSREARI